MSSQKRLKKDLRELMKLPENSTCADCGDKFPTWASLIVAPPEAPFTGPIGCFCCYHCSGAHRRMGVHICFVRSTNLDEWKEKEVLAMKDGGNALVNSLFEAKLSDDTIKPNKHSELNERSNFIYEKYQHRKWYDPSSYKSKQEAVVLEEDLFAGFRDGSQANDEWFASFPEG